MTIVSYPRSGRTWLTWMLADALEVPLANKFSAERIEDLSKEVTPESKVEYVLAQHSGDPARLIESGQRIVYLLRDPRDVAVSYYFYQHVRKQARRGVLGRMTHGLLRLVSRGGQPTLRQDLPSTLEEWREHVLTWLPHFADVAVVRYEDLHADALSTLSALCSELDIEFHPGSLRASVEKHRFQTEVGRTPGTEEPTAFRRKGIIGDWRTHFGPEERQITKAAVGDLLVELGYEESTAW